MQDGYLVRIQVDTSYFSVVSDSTGVERKSFSAQESLFLTHRATANIGGHLYTHGARCSGYFVFRASTLALQRVFFSDGRKDLRTASVKIMTTYSAVARWVILNSPDLFYL